MKPRHRKPKRKKAPDELNEILVPCQSYSSQNEDPIFFWYQLNEL